MSNRDPKVAVVIPTYNGLPFLKEAVQSVLAQTYLNFTLYIVDDGSTDGTGNYMRSLKDRRVKYLPKANGGLASARNYGVSHSKEPLIAFLDADDFWYPEKLAKQVALMVKNPALGVVYGFQKTIGETGKILGHLEYRNRGYVFDRLLGGNFVSGSGSMVLVRRWAFKEVGLFRKDFKIGEDWEMWLRIAQRFEFDFVPEYLAAIRIREGGMQKNHQRMAEGLEYLRATVLREFDLNSRQRRRLVFPTLMDAAVHYRLARVRGRAVWALVKGFWKNPVALFYVRKWSAYLFVLTGFEIGAFLKRRFPRLFTV